MNLLPPRNTTPVRPTDNTDPAAVAIARAKGVAQELAPLYVLFHWRMHTLGHKVNTTQIWRSTAAQAKLYARGRSEPGTIVTHAPPGTSPHECSLYGKPASQAFDVAPIINGSIYWPTDETSAPFWSDARDSAKMLGLKWGGDFKRPAGDYGHFQLSTFERVTQ